jgi:hypothetical protein
MIRAHGISMGIRVSLVLLASLAGWLVFLLYEVGLGSLMDAVNDLF